jgi:dolichol-phosphate mannosyltransferase
MQQYDYTIVIPTYNERENITKLLGKLEKRLKGLNYQIIVADDDSPDRTWEAVEEFGKTNPDISCLRRKGRERGLSRSIIDGFNQAQGNVFAVLDGDMQHDESYLPEILKTAEDYDMVLGTRHADGGGIEGGWPLSRRIASWCAARTARLLLGISVSDPMSGYFAVQKELYERIKDKLNPSGFKIMLEILYISTVYCDNVRVKETGIKFRPRVAGKSKLGGKVIFEYFISLLRLRSEARKKD